MGCDSQFDREPVKDTRVLMQDSLPRGFSIWQATVYAKWNGYTHIFYKGYLDEKGVLYEVFRNGNSYSLKKMGDAFTDASKDARRMADYNADKYGLKHGGNAPPRAVVTKKKDEPKTHTKSVFIAVAANGNGHVSFPSKKDATDYIRNIWKPMGFEGIVVKGTLTWKDPDTTYVTGSGQTIITHKKRIDCEDGCVIHRPSGHKLTGFKTHWRDDTSIMERICHHGVGHPDPDDIAWRARTFGDEQARVAGIHGCDGCC